MIYPSPKFNINDPVILTWSGIKGNVIGRGYSKAHHCWCYILDTHHNTRVLAWINGESMDQNTVEYSSIINEFNQNFWSVCEDAMSLASDRDINSGKDIANNCDDNGGLSYL